ncbi:isoaspartyl peptidase/L-asparaginase, partial [Brevundimonas sp.]|uniref:isoaspartyl peptidase/L-asparaginase n=1 Tax=Brevundimonas sp. TaxID=1871086 RepID=UPI0025E1DA11
TGTGEYFIRATVARDVCGRLSYAGETIQQASDAEIGEVGALGGDGGLIALTDEGEVAFSMNTSGMYRGSASWNAAPQVAIYADE